jgi:hypothetical protein
LEEVVIAAARHLLPTLFGEVHTPVARLAQPHNRYPPSDQRDAICEDVRMMNGSKATNPWIQTIEVLRTVSGASGTRSMRPVTKAKAALDPTFPRSKNCVIRVTDRTSPSTVTVEWCDATVAHYGAQLWRLGSARVAGSCAVCGAVISRGEAVYRPYIGRLPPQNRNAMILASTVDKMLGVESS